MSGTLALNRGLRVFMPAKWNLSFRRIRYVKPMPD